MNSFPLRYNGCSKFIKINLRYFFIFEFYSLKVFVFKLQGEFQCIGTTTLDKYQKYIEKDPVLDEYFQRILVKEASIIECISTLRALKGRYESHFGGITNSFLFSNYP